MRFLQVLLWIVFSLTVTRAVDLHSKNSHLRLLSTRLEAADTEERGIVAWFKSTYWAWSGKSEAEVKAKLGLTGMTDAAMKDSPKFKTFQIFRYKAEGLKLDDMVYDKTYTPSSFWRSLKLDQMTEARRKGSNELQMYERFLKRYDAMVYKGYKGYQEQFPSTQAERMSYLKVWAKADREESYVKKMLDIDHGTSHYVHAYHRMMTSWKPEKEIMSHPNYKYLVHFRKLRDQW